MTLAEKIRQAAMLMHERRSFQMTLHRDEWMQIYEALHAAAPEAREKIIEECAKVCDAAADQCTQQLDSTFQSEYLRGCRNEADSLGTAIRALKTPREPQRESE